MEHARINLHPVGYNGASSPKKACGPICEKLSVKFWEHNHLISLENPEDVFANRATLRSARTSTYCDIVSMFLVSSGALDQLPMFPTQYARNTMPEAVMRLVYPPRFVVGIWSANTSDAT